MTRNTVIDAGRGVRLLLVRHAAHDDIGRRLTGRARDVGLSEDGARQAEAVARRLAPECPSAVQTSPRQRARATAEALSRASGASLRVADPLDEIDFGEWTGADFDDLAADPCWRAWNAQRSTARPPGGESMAEAVERISSHVAGLAARSAGELVALVTHADIIRGFISHCLGLSLDNLLRFDIAPASFSRVEVWDWDTRVLSVNETPWPR